MAAGARGCEAEEGERRVVAGAAGRPEGLSVASGEWRVWRQRPGKRGTPRASGEGDQAAAQAGVGTVEMGLCLQRSCCRHGRGPS